MSKVLTGSTPAQSFTFERPDGQHVLVAHVEVDDSQISRLKPDFDLRERVSIHHASEGSASWTPVASEDYRGRTSEGRDVHTAAKVLGASSANLAALYRHGVSASLEADGGAAGTELIHLQSFGRNAPVYDVGAVDDKGVAWTSPLYANRISRTHHDVRELKDGETVSFSQHNFGAPGNLRIELEVFAPEITPFKSLSRRQIHQHIAEMDLRIESNFLPPGRSQQLDFLGRGGPHGNNFRVMFQLADPSIMNPSPATGVYAFEVKLGDRTLGTFKLDWKNR